MQVTKYGILSEEKGIAAALFEFIQLSFQKIAFFMTIQWLGGFRLDTPLRKGWRGVFNHHSYHLFFYGLAGAGCSGVVLGGGEEVFSGVPDEGEAGHEAGEGNSLMVTVTRFVVTSVTTTSLQLGAISGCQSGSPSAGTRLGSAGVELGSPERTRGRASCWRLGRRWRPEPSSSSPSKEEEGDKGKEGDATGFSSGGEVRADSGGGLLHSGPSLEGGAPGADWDSGAAVVVGDVPPEPVELEGEGGDWHWEEVDRVFLAPVLEQDPGWG